MNYPRGSALASLLGLESSNARKINFDELFKESLTGPIDDFFGRPRKNLRNTLVELGFEIAERFSDQNANSDSLALARKTCCEILETFHAGSLVVDDIEDGSLYRRGQKSLHHLHGIPKALNAGNWLYFLPFQMIEEMELAPERKYALVQECQRTLLRAHYGQALDLGVNVADLAQEKVADICLAAIELKSGALAGLALSLGATALGAPVKVKSVLEKIGHRFGTALQMFDDIGNLSSKNDSAKKCEDLKLKRCGFVLAVSARELPAHDYQEFLSLSAALPETCEALLAFIEEKQIVQTARTQAMNFLNSAVAELNSEIQLQAEEIRIVESIQCALRGSYE